jgi:glycosyltransferase involved in cell wall biosynthesis
VFDFSSVGTYHCGTFEVAKQLLVHALELWRDRFHVHVLVCEEAKRFHRLDDLPGLLFVPPDTTRIFAIAFRCGQPFDERALVRMGELAALNVYAMLDTISYDCQYLDQPNLRTLWQFVMAHADGVVYISHFVRRQFHLRFRKRQGLHEVVAYPSMDPDDYRIGDLPGIAGKYLLVVGNKFEHKRVVPTVEALVRAFPFEKIVVVGTDGTFGRNVVCRPSGNLSEREMDNIYRDAKAVVFPSLYEGFGIPVARALALERPVLARSIPAMRELRERLPNRENLHLYRTTKDLIERLRDGVPEWQRASTAQDDEPRLGWRAAVSEIGAMLERALATYSVEEILIPRLETLQGWGLSGSAGAGIQQAQSRLDDLEHQLADLRNSWSWKATAPLRTLAGWYLKLVRH